MKRSYGATPFPNVLLDVFMPRLRDTEWRVLCVIVRSTLGWRVPGGGRKHEDWISHAQLKRRTGRYSEAISRAVQSLVDKGLIAVRDEVGRELHSSRLRELHRSRVFYSLSSGILSFLSTVSIFEAREPKATKEKPTKEEIRRGKSAWFRAGDFSGRRITGGTLD